MYDGKHLPFEDRWFDAVGALNVLEHVEEPEPLPELVRVGPNPGGRIVVSSPNFLRVFDFEITTSECEGLGTSGGTGSSSGASGARCSAIPMRSDSSA